MPTEYNKSHIQGISKKNGKIEHWIILYCFFREVISKTRASCFITISKHSKTIKALGRFICFLVFGNRDETLALVFEIVLLN